MLSLFTMHQAFLDVREARDAAFKLWLAEEAEDLNERLLPAKCEGLVLACKGG